ncbi:RNA polymerase sigma-54 factor [Caloramator mitchellensis]|uniref:RNA polymerase sigma-54 factor n=1 Tax=Caloramator mitchellensis TaxID=908809 RepID=A0A0R3K528_CALMK|nr:RNA polymerase factor sigma-54 [Caloramator mitchellensis]KRQ88034.1 RNA polymerase sigma-54 factor [Caloramator mitchellensis]
MNSSFELNLNQRQSLSMSQDMQLSLSILQMNIMELEQFINEEVCNNPVIDFDDSIEHYIDYRKKGSDYNGQLETIEENNFELNLIIEENLHDLLKKQLRLSGLDNKSLKIGYYIIDNINEQGYLESDEMEIASHFRCSIEEVLKVLYIIQGFEPNGIGGKNIEECLIIQLRNLKKLNNDLEAIIKNHLKDIAKGNFNKIISNLKIEKDVLNHYVKLIKSLNPKPGLSFCIKNTEYVYPDLIVKNENGELQIDLLKDILPVLKINKEYLNLINDRSSKEFKFIKEKIKRAFLVMNSIEKRKKTLLKISRVILEQQINFLEGSHLNPISLKQIAEKTNLHVSTISRAVSGKFVLTDRGLFELKHFIQRETKKDEISYSVDFIKNKIKNMIEEEDKQKPLSDEKISSLLKTYGLDIARRTIAKYREELGIPSSNLRKFI